jgi:predicted FMN-binding regulatory protein PaiB
MRAYSLGTLVVHTDTGLDANHIPFQLSQNKTATDVAGAADALNVRAQQRLADTMRIAAETTKP